MTARLKIPALRLCLAGLCLAASLCQSALAATEVGPFRAAGDASLYLEGLSVPSQTRSQTEQVPYDYIIVSAPIGLQPAILLLADLREKNISDVTYVHTGEFGGRVSAGVFRSRGPSAERRLQSILDDGFEFEKMPRTTQTIQTFWVRTETDIPTAIIASVEQTLGYELKVVRLAEAVAATDLHAKTQAGSSPENTNSIEADKDIDIDKETSVSTALINEPPATTVELSKDATKQQIEQPSPWLLYFSACLALVIVGVVARYFVVRSGRPAPIVSAQILSAERTTDSEQMSGDETDSTEALPASPDANSSVNLDLINDLAGPTQHEPAIPTRDEGDESAESAESVNSASFDLAALMLTAVNDARSLHPISTLKYRAVSLLPKVHGDATAISHIVSSIIRQAVNFDDAAHILIQADYHHDSLTLSCLNEGALLTETELLEVRDLQTQSGLSLAALEKLATHMQGGVVLSSKFGTGTNITLSIELIAAQQEAMLNRDQLTDISELRTRLIESREVTTPAARAGIAALEALLSTSTKPQEVSAAITAMTQQLRAVEHAEHHTVEMLEALLGLANESQVSINSDEQRVERQLSQIAAELNQAKPPERSESSTKAFLPYGPRDGRAELLFQLMDQLTEIETARAQGDLQTLGRIARWTGKYADGLGMTLIASMFRTIDESMRQGDERLMLEALTMIHMGLSRLKEENQTDIKLA